MKALHKLGHVAAAAGLSAVMAFSAVPANASPEGRDALLGAGIGAVAGGLLGHGKIGPVIGGAAVGAAVGSLAGHDYNKHKGVYYDRYGYRHRYVYYTRHRRHYEYDRYGYYDPYGYYPRG